MKIIEIPKPLNPQAQEWRPTPHPPPLQPLPLIQPSSPTKLLHHLPTYFYYHYLLSHTLYRPHLLFPAAMPTSEEEAGIKNLERETGDGVAEEQKVSPGAKCPKHPRRDVSKGQKKFLPPRLQRALRSPNAAKNHHHHHQPPPPSKREKQTKKEWRLKNDRTAAPPASPTTVMIRNIPNQIRRSFLLKFLDHYCKIYSLEYDFLYLPVDFRKLGNLGYAFVNLTTAADANKLKKILCNYRWRSFTTDDGEAIDSSKVVKITWARIQGKEALIRRFQNSKFSCTDPEFLPVVLDPPRNGSDPNPSPPRILGTCRRLVQ